jgi:phosphoglycolate phosphatase
MGSKHGAIFDLDGTLVDTIEDLTHSFNRALVSLGYPHHTLSEFKAMVGEGVTRLTESALPPGSRDEAKVAELRAAFQADYAKHLLDNSVPFPGITDLLGRLASKGWPMGVLSNKDQGNSETMVGRLFPGTFKAVFGAIPERPYKPDPKGALELARILERDPQAIFYFGDSDTDMRLARNAGFVPIGVSWGFRPWEVVRDAGAKAILGRPLDFLKVFRELAGGLL